MPAFSAGVAASPLTWARNSAAAIHFGKQRPYLLTGWLWYIVMLAPVIGIVHRQFSVDMTAEVFSP